jgi:hypothetical protein
LKAFFVEKERSWKKSYFGVYFAVFNGKVLGFFEESFFEKKIPFTPPPLEPITREGNNHLSPITPDPFPLRGSSNPSAWAKMGARVQRRPIPAPFFGPGCTSYIDFLSFWTPLSTFSVPGSGSWIQSFKLPNNTGLLGVRLALQALFSRTSQNRWEMSNGYLLAIGN